MRTKVDWAKWLGKKMTNTATVRKVGNSLALSLTDSLKKMNLAAGDEVYITETPRGIEISRYDPDFDQAMEAARAFMKGHPNMMKELAK